MRMSANAKWAQGIFMSDECVRPDRIIHDIDKVEPSYKKVVAAGGVVVPELGLRSGHRKAMSKFSVGDKLTATAKAALDAQMVSWIGLTKAM